MSLYLVDVRIKKKEIYDLLERVELKFGVSPSDFIAIGVMEATAVVRKKVRRGVYSWEIDMRERARVQDSALSLLSKDDDSLSTEYMRIVQNLGNLIRSSMGRIQDEVITMRGNTSRFDYRRGVIIIEDSYD